MTCLESFISKYWIAVKPSLFNVQEDQRVTRAQSDVWESWLPYPVDNSPSELPGDTAGNVIFPETLE